MSLGDTQRSQMVKCQADGDKQQEDLPELGEWAEKGQMSLGRDVRRTRQSI